MYAASGGAGPVLLGFLSWLIIFAAYTAPAFVAIFRRVPSTGSVIVVNLLLGWTVVGWIVALAMACRSKPPPYTPPPPPSWPATYPTRERGR